MAFRLGLPGLASNKIDVRLSGEIHGDNSDLKVSYDGYDIHVISDTERNIFNLNDDNLKNAVSSYFGKRPDDAYLRSPTPWGDLYLSYGWTQVMRLLKPQNGKILKVSSQPIIVLEQAFENNSSVAATFNTTISKKVENRVSYSWSTGELPIGKDISYTFNFVVDKVGGETSFSFTSSWGQNTEQSQTVTVGATSMEITVQPGQSVIAQLHVIRNSIQIQMDYEASLCGQSAVNYGETYMDHHFWALNIGALMHSAGLSNQMVSREIIDIEFYSNSKVTVVDKKNGNKLMEVTF